MIRVQKAVCGREVFWLLHTECSFENDTSLVIQYNWQHYNTPYNTEYLEYLLRQMLKLATPLANKIHTCSTTLCVVNTILNCTLMLYAVRITAVYTSSHMHHNNKSDRQRLRHLAGHSHYTINHSNNNAIIVVSTHRMWCCITS